MLDDCPLFANKRIYLSSTKNVPVGNKVAFTSLIALYDVLEVYLQKKGARAKYWNPEPEVDSAYQNALDLWSTLIDSFHPLKEVAGSPESENIAASYRHEGGGHILFRPAGLMIVVTTITEFRKAGLGLADAVRRVARAPMDLSDRLWAGVLWDPINNRMVTAAANQKVAFHLLYSSVGGDLSTLHTDSKRLSEDWASVRGLESNKDELPHF
jgi:DNA sulfur modification protein DndB